MISILATAASLKLLARSKMHKIAADRPLHTGHLHTQQILAVDQWADVRASVHLWEAQQGIEIVHWPVQHCKEQDGQGGEDDIEGCSANAVHHGLPAEAAVELVVEEQEAKGDVLVEGVFDEPRQPIC